MEKPYPDPPESVRSAYYRASNGARTTKFQVRW